ncbi:hypothetical protein V1506DRAFT_545206 [Lipomyces tetrasporus]
MAWHQRVFLALILALTPCGHWQNSEDKRRRFSLYGLNEFDPATVLKCTGEMLSPPECRTSYGGRSRSAQS